MTITFGNNTLFSPLVTVAYDKYIHMVLLTRPSPRPGAYRGTKPSNMCPGPRQIPDQFLWSRGIRGSHPFRT
jgi:hypothetical protein